MTGQPDSAAGLSFERDVRPMFREKDRDSDAQSLRPLRGVSPAATYPPAKPENKTANAATAVVGAATQALPEHSVPTAMAAAPTRVRHR